MAQLKFGIIPIEGGQFYREALEEVVRAEELDFDSVWMEEHHGVKDHYWPSPLTVPGPQGCCLGLTSSSCRFIIRCVWLRMWYCLT